MYIRRVRYYKYSLLLLSLSCLHDKDRSTTIIFDLGSNMEFRWGRGNGWFLVGVCADHEDNNEAFTLEIACELIGETPQRDGVQVIHQNEEE